MRKALFILLVLMNWYPVMGQDTVEYTSGTFKATHVVIGQSVETTPSGNFQFLVSHHFGLISGGYQNLFGLNQAFIRIGAEYGITDRLTLGAGLNTYQITWDGYAKFKILRQCKGTRNMPFTLTGFASAAVNTVKWGDTARADYPTNRFSYAFELILARKFNKWFSFQISPAMVHKNLVATAKDHNDIFALGAGARFRLSRRVAINAEYYYVFPNQVNESGDLPDIHNSASIGVDIETGGHVFQIFLTNSQGLIEQHFIPDTQGDWLKGDIYLGFNISRMLPTGRSKAD